MQLIINQYSGSPVSSQSTLTDEEIDEYISLAMQAMDNEAYELAVEYCRTLYNQHALSSYGKYKYAECLRLTENYLEALTLFKEITPEINSFELDTQIWIYYGMQRCFNGIGEYASSIQYGQLALQKTTFADKHREGILYNISRAYNKLGNHYTSLRTITSEIQKYLSYMGIKATDCWDKEYKDPYLADLYYDAYLWSESSSDTEKYLIISAAWGHNRAIEKAKEYYLTYTEKPRNYVY